MPKIFPSRTGAIAVTLLLLSSSASFALDASSVVERYKAFVGKQGQNFSYEAIENATGDSFSLKGASLTFQKITPIKVGNVTFSGIMENSDGSIRIGRISYEQVSFGDKQVTGTLDQASIDNFIVPSDTESDPLKGLINYTGFQMGNLKIVADGNTVASMAAAKVTIDPLTREAPMAMRGEITGVKADFASVKDAGFKKGLQQLGYGEQFSGKVILDGSWNAADGRFELKTYDFQIDNIGTLGIALVINGYTAELAKRLQEASAKADDDQAMTMAMMQELPNLSLVSAAISFKDDSITKRVLKLQASKMGGSPDDVAKMVPVMVPMALSGLGNPGFSNMVAAALGRFVGEPGNIKISANPPKPVPFSELMGIGMAAPQTLPDALSVKVTANE